MTSTHELGAQSALDWFLTDPDGGRALLVYREGIHAGRYGDLQDVIHQDWRDQWPAGQIACFAMVYSEICAGQVAHVQVSAAGSPLADRDRQGNARLVSDLPRPFTAEVDQDQNCDDQDGWLRWSEPIQVEVSTGVPVIGPDGTPSPRMAVRELPPGSAPLEIGTTSASTTLLHLRGDRAVARWPYGHQRIRLLVAVGEPWQQLAGL